MSKRNSVQYVKQVPKFLQQYQQQYPELTAKTSLHAAADAHDAREEERASRHHTRDVQLPVVVNMDDFKDELHQPNNALLLAEITTGLDPDQLTDHIELQQQAEVLDTNRTEVDRTEHKANEGIEQPTEQAPDLSEEITERERISLIEEEGRHAFRRRQKSSRAHPRKTITKARQGQVNVLSFETHD